MAEYIMKKRNVPDGKKIICSVIAEEGILHLKQCQRSIREAAITVAFFLQSIHHLPVSYTHLTLPTTTSV